MLRSDELPNLTVNGVVNRWPAAMPVFRRFGIDMCCGGWMTVERAARQAGVAPEDVCAALIKVLPAPDSAASRQESDVS